MKNLIKLIGITAFVAAIGFTVIACGNGTIGGGGGGNNTRDPATYTGTVNDVAYTLKIEECARTILTPAANDKYTLTEGEGADAKVSTGRVESFINFVFTLIPSNSTITVRYPRQSRGLEL